MVEVNGKDVGRRKVNTFDRAWDESNARVGASQNASIDELHGIGIDFDETASPWAETIRRLSDENAELARLVVGQAIEVMAEDLAKTYLLVWVEGQSMRQAGRRLGVSQTQVFRRVRRIESIVRRALQDAGIDDEVLKREGGEV